MISEGFLTLWTDLRHLSRRFILHLIIRLLLLLELLLLFYLTRAWCFIIVLLQWKDSVLYSFLMRLTSALENLECWKGRSHRSMLNINFLVVFSNLCIASHVDCNQFCTFPSFLDAILAVLGFFSIIWVPNWLSFTLHCRRSMEMLYSACYWSCRESFISLKQWVLDFELMPCLTCFFAWPHYLINGGRKIVLEKTFLLIAFMIPI